MGKQRPQNGTLAWFDSLSKRDFDNGATLDEIAEVYKQRDSLLEACKRLRADAEVYGLMGSTNIPAVRCEVKGLTLGHWYNLDDAIAKAEGRK